MEHSLDLPEVAIKVSDVLKVPYMDEAAPDVQFHFQSDTGLSIPDVTVTQGRDDINPNIVCFRLLRPDAVKQKVVPLAPLAQHGIPAGTPAIESFKVHLNMASGYLVQAAAPDNDSTNPHS